MTNLKLAFILLVVAVGFGGCDDIYKSIKGQRKLTFRDSGKDVVVVDEVSGTAFAYRSGALIEIPVVTQRALRPKNYEETGIANLGLEAQVVLALGSKEMLVKVRFNKPSLTTSGDDGGRKLSLEKRKANWTAVFGKDSKFRPVAMLVLRITDVNQLALASVELEPQSATRTVDEEGQAIVYNFERSLPMSEPEYARISGVVFSWRNP